jgi:hypothetical protein
MQRGSQSLVLLMPNRDGISVKLDEEIGAEHAGTQWSYVDLGTGEISSSLAQRLAAPVLLMS